MSATLDTDLAPIDDFADLDSLLAGAIKAAAERKALKAKTRNPCLLSPEDRAAIEAAAELQRWQEVAAIARFVEVRCTQCGATHRQFDGWFILSTLARQPATRRFRRANSHEGLPAWNYVAQEEACNCVECLPHLPLWDPLMEGEIEALGPYALTCPGQLSLPIEPDLLEELDAEEEEAEVEAAEAIEDHPVNQRLAAPTNTFVEGSLLSMLYDQIHQTSGGSNVRID